MTPNLVIIALVLGSFAYILVFPGRRGRNLPPGPPTLPIIGNLHQLPKEKIFLKFDQWSKKYGSMYSIKIASSTAIVLTDRRLVKELMDKQSAVSSNRPKAYIADTILYEGDDIILMQANNPHWKIARRFIHQNFMGSVVEKQHMTLLNAEAVQMIREMCITPQDFMKHPKRFANSFMMSVAYGIRTPHAEISHMVQISKVLSETTTLLQPGTLPPVDSFPFLKLVPERLLGNWYTRVMETRKSMNELYSSYLDLVVRRRKKSGPRESFADRLIEQQEQLDWTWHGLYFLGGLMMEAGSDTTSGAINSFLLLMTKFPDAYKKSQQQIDAYVGDERSPTWADFDHLPAVNSVLKETMRFRPISPIAFPHALSEDVWLEGKLLPKGSDIIVNVLGLHFDESRFPNPEVFDPERYADHPALASQYASTPDYEARDHYSYGVGRRICPGIHLAERALFVTLAKIIWAFDISPGRDTKGNLIGPDISHETGYIGGIVVTPQDFKCELRSRSEKRKEVILSEFREAEKNVFPKYDVPSK